MIVLVCNIGSTSFKFKLFEFGEGERAIAEGGCDRIGLGRSAWKIVAGPTTAEGVADLADHAAAIELHLQELVKVGVIDSIDRVDAVGFKAVHGGSISDPVVVDDNVLAVQESMIDVAPAHNPAYIAAMRAFRDKLPDVPQVAAFETGFHQTIPMSRRVYGVPHEWIEKYGVLRYGFHGASHRYIAVRMAEIAPQSKRIISCHLGGSCSISAIKDGRSEANSFGMTAQSGVFHGGRVGDFDSFIIPMLLKQGMDIGAIFKKLGKEGGLAGLSGVNADMRDVQEAAAKGNAKAKLAVDAFIESIRHYVGAYLAVLNGADALVFTGGIGQHNRAIRSAVCANMQYANIHLDEAKNNSVKGSDESRIDAGKGIAIWIVPTNEELIVARQTVATLNASTV